jgi:hypothetical protein
MSGCLRELPCLWHSHLAWFTAAPKIQGAMWCLSVAAMVVGHQYLGGAATTRPLASTASSPLMYFEGGTGFGG